MGEFDLSLIREFRSRPAFYDRSLPLFKDKVYTAHEWQEISNKLGYDVSLLKDRMLQLRNRYNLEKRRLEQVREENPGKTVQSPWPLYEHLHFLSDHIRSRRSYKRMQPAMAPTELSNSGSNPSSLGAIMCHAAAPFANGMLAVKMEEEEDEEEPEDEEEDTDAESGSKSGNDNQAAISQPPSYNVMQVNREHSSRSNNNVAPSITIRRLDTMRDATAANVNANVRSTHGSHGLHGSQKTSSGHKRQRASKPSTSANAASKGDSLPSVAKQICLSAQDAKYLAFGQFISASLLELPQKKALQLVEQFTSELVRVLIARNETQAKAATPPVENNHSNGDVATQSDRD